MAILNLNKNENISDKEQEQARPENFAQISFNSNAMRGGFYKKY